MGGGFTYAESGVMPQIEQCRQRFSLGSDEEGEFFAEGVCSYGTRRSQKTMPDEVSRQTEVLPYTTRLLARTFHAHKHNAEIMP